MNNDIKYVLHQALQEFRENKNNLLFCTYEGKIIKETSSNSCFKRLCKKYKIVKEYDPHQNMLRHSRSDKINRKW